MSSSRLALLPPEVVKVTAVNAATGREESIFVFEEHESNEDKRVFNSIVNYLVFDAPLHLSDENGAPPIIAPAEPAAATAAAAVATAAAAAAAPSTSKKEKNSLRSAVEASFGKRFDSTAYSFSPSPSGPDANLLIFLAGSGETTASNNFLALGRSMSLPQTAVLSLVGCHDLPFDLGRCWFHEMDYETGDALPLSSPSLLSSLSFSVRLLLSCLSDLSSRLPGTPLTSLSSVFLFGFSSGATLAAELSLSLATARRPPLGGAVCVRGGLLPPLDDSSPSSPPGGPKPPSWTPLLLLLGDKDESCPPRRAVAAAAARYGGEGRGEGGNQGGVVTAVTSKGVGHEMIKGEEESRSIFEFLAPKLCRSKENI